MVLHVLRALFVLLMAAVGEYFIHKGISPFYEYPNATMAGLITAGVLLVCVDILAPRRKLAVFSGTFLGLMVGLLIAYALSFVVQLLFEQYVFPGSSFSTESQRSDLLRAADLIVGMFCCYLSISFVLQTKDDFRFIVPYVEFRKQTKGNRPMLLDTSVLIDGRITDIAETGILDSQLLVPRFVLQELQAVADSADRLKRNRGRRGLDVLAKLQSDPHLEVLLSEATPREEASGVDEQLMNLARELNGSVLTNDFNLNKVAQLRGVHVININDLANALKPVMLPGERMNVKVVKPGEAPGQGVGYLEDGTMVVIEQARSRINQDVAIIVTSALQTSAGRMIFGRLSDGTAEHDEAPSEPPRHGPARRSRADSDQPSTTS